MVPLLKIIRDRSVYKARPSGIQNGGLISAFDRQSSHSLPEYGSLLLAEME
jgi:hypothetical protein